MARREGNSLSLQRASRAAASAQKIYAVLQEIHLMAVLAVGTCRRESDHQRKKTFAHIAKLSAGAIRRK